jgi:hypothetical protein
MKITLLVGVGALAILAACSGSSAGGDVTGIETPPRPGSDSGVPTTEDGSVPPQSDSGGPLPSDGGADSSTPLDSGGDARAEPSCAGLAYCENFESYPAGAVVNNATVGPWTATTSGAAAMTIDSVRPYGGTKSLHIKVPTADIGASALLNITKPAGLITGNNLFGRAMVYYTKSATEDKPNGVHSWIFQGTGLSTASGKTMTLNLANNGTSYFLNYHGDTTISAEASKNGGTPVAAKWVCVQWQFDSAGTPAADDAKVFVDGSLALEATKAAQNWNLATPFSKMQFGFTHYQTLSNAIDVYLDDFAVNTATIPCP